MFHALSGCDTSSSFRGNGKKSFWQAWQAFEEVTETVAYFASDPFKSLDVCEHFYKIERLIVIGYDKASTSHSINQTRKELFCPKSVTMEKMPPTRNCWSKTPKGRCTRLQSGQRVLKHSKRSLHQRNLLGKKWQVGGFQFG